MELIQMWYSLPIKQEWVNASEMLRIYFLICFVLRMQYHYTSNAILPENWSCSISDISRHLLMLMNSPYCTLWTFSHYQKCGNCNTKMTPEKLPIMTKHCSIYCQGEWTFQDLRVWGIRNSHKIKLIATEHTAECHINLMHKHNHDLNS